MSKYAKILGTKFYCDDLSQEITIKEYLKELLQRVWKEGESFSGKRPFGNSGWQADLYLPLIAAGFITGTVDEDGYLEDCDEKAGDELISEIISRL